MQQTASNQPPTVVDAQGLTRVFMAKSGPVQALLQTIRDGDLLVLGSRGRGTLRASVFGSTVNSVLDRCAVPVAVIRAADDE